MLRSLIRFILEKRKCIYLYVFCKFIVILSSGTKWKSFYLFIYFLMITQGQNLDFEFYILDPTTTKTNWRRFMFASGCSPLPWNSLQLLFNHEFQQLSWWFRISSPNRRPTTKNNIKRLKIMWKLLMLVQSDQTRWGKKKKNLKKSKNITMLSRLRKTKRATGVPILFLVIVLN